MAKKSIINVNKNSATTIDFDLAIEGVETSTTKATLIIENVIDGCDIAIAAKQKDGKWSVVVPNIKNFNEGEYNVRLDVVVDGYYFTPASGKMKLVDAPVVEVTSIEAPVIEEAVELVVEGDEDGVKRATDALDKADAEEELPVTVGPNTSKEGAELAARVTYPPAGDGSETKKEFSDKAKKDEINADKIREIASSVNGTQGPQLPFDKESVKEEARAALGAMMPILRSKKKVVESDKGTLLRPKMKKIDEKKERAVREALGLSNDS